MCWLFGLVYQDVNDRIDFVVYEEPKKKMDNYMKDEKSLLVCYRDFILNRLKADKFEGLFDLRESLKSIKWIFLVEIYD